MQTASPKIVPSLTWKFILWMNEVWVIITLYISNIFSLQILFRNALTSYLKAPQIEGSQLPALPKPRGRVYPVRPKVAPEKKRKAIEVKTTPTVVKSPRGMMSGCSSNKLISIFAIFLVAQSFSAQFSWKTVRFSEQIICADKYLSIFRAK